MATTIRPRRGTPISLRAAARAYGISPSTLSRWAHRGLIAILAASPGRGYPLILDKASVHTAAELYRQDPGRGKRTAFKPRGSVILVTEPVGYNRQIQKREAP